MPLEEIKSGTVVYYNPAKHYGFIRSDDQEKVFFHANGRGGPKFSERMYPCFRREVNLDLYSASAKPLVNGDRLCYREVKEPKGIRAWAWCFENIWQAAVESVSNTQFRVLRQLTVQKKACWVEHLPEVYFEGTVEQLEGKYPRSLTDALKPSDGSLVKSNYVFSYFDSGQWVECKDPRTPEPGVRSY